MCTYICVYTYIRTYLYVGLIIYVFIYIFPCDVLVFKESSLTFQFLEPSFQNMKTCRYIIFHTSVCRFDICLLNNLFSYSLHGRCCAGDVYRH